MTGIFFTMRASDVMVKRFEQLMKMIFDNDFVVWLTILLVIVANIFGNVEPVKFIKLCATLGFMYAAFAYVETRRLRRLITDKKGETS